MSSLHQCDRCGRQSKDPKVENWITLYAAMPSVFGKPFEHIAEDDLARRDELCLSCRNAFDDWMTEAT